MILCELKNLSLSEIFCSLWAHVSSFGQLRPRQQDVRYKMPAHEIGNISQNERFISLKSILFPQRELAPLVIKEVVNSRTWTNDCLRTIKMVIQSHTGSMIYTLHQIHRDRDEVLKG